MKNKGSKIIILIVCCLVAVGGVLFYLKTVVSPPTPPTLSNQYEIFLKNNIDSLNYIGEYGELETQYMASVDLMQRLYEEERILNETYDQSYKDIIGIYAPKFSNYSLSLFKNSTWNEGDLNKIEKKAKELKSLTINDGAERIMNHFPEENGNLNIIIGTIEKYREAKNFAKNTRFTSIEDVRTRLNRKNSYTSDPYLSNNRDLMASLNNMSSRIKQSHLSNLKGKVDAMADWRRFNSKKEFETYKNTVWDAISAYKNNAKALYGSSNPGNDTRQLESSYDLFETRTGEYLNEQDYN